MQAITAVVIQIFQCEAEPAEVVGVVGKGQVPAEVSSPDLTSPGLHCFKDHRLLGDKALGRSKDLAGLGSVFRRYEVGVGAIGVFTGEAEHAGAKRRED